MQDAHLEKTSKGIPDAKKFAKEVFVTPSLSEAPKGSLSREKQTWAFDSRPARLPSLPPVTTAAPAWLSKCGFRALGLRVFE